MCNIDGELGEELVPANKVRLAVQLDHRCTDAADSFKARTLGQHAGCYHALVRLPRSDLGCLGFASADEVLLEPRECIGDVVVRRRERFAGLGQADLRLLAQLGDERNGNFYG